MTAFWKLHLSALAMGATFAFCGQSASALPINGSFEDDLCCTGQNGATGVSGPGWAIVPSLIGWSGGTPFIDPITGKRNGIEIRNNIAGAAYNGNNYVELDTDQNSLASQILGTTTGDKYTLSFAYAPREGVADTSNGIQVFWNGLAVGTFTATGVGPGNVWSIYSISNLVALGNDVLMFKAVGTSDSYGGSLDFINLDSAGPANPVPLPAAAWLFGSALVGLTALSRRRRKTSSLSE